jgi:hypothetical protein
MRKKSICISLFLCFVLLSVSYAGAYVPWYEDSRSQKLVVPKSSSPDSDIGSVPSHDPFVEQPEEKTIVVEKRYVPEKMPPLKGSAIGFYSSIPSILIDNPYWPIELGLCLDNQDSAGLIRLTYPLGSIDSGYLSFQAGILGLIDSNTQLPIGLSLGIRQYLSPFVSLDLDIYPLRFGSGWRLGDAMIGAKVHF